MGKVLDKPILVFDLHNVLFKPQGRELFRIIRSVPHKITLLKHLFNPFFLYKALSLADRYGLGQGSLHMLFDLYPALKPYEPWLFTLINAQQPIKEMFQIVESLHAQGYPLYVFSNMGAYSFEALRKKYPAIFLLFQGHHYYGAKTEWTQKPSQESFKSFLTRFNLNPTSIIFIDNSIRNVEQARELSIDAICYTNAHTLIQELQRRGIFP